MAEKKLKIKITTEGAQKSAQQANGLTASYKKVAGSIAAMGAAYVVVTKAARFFSDSIKLAASQEDIFKKLQTSIELTGKSYDAVSVKINRTFKSMQALTEYGDTESAAALTQLVLLSGDFEQSLSALPITLDLAATGLFDLQAASRLMGMALSGNVEMLGRYIPELKSTVSPQLKLMSAAEKSAFAMDLLQTKFGGTAQANLDSYNKKLNQMGDYWGDIREALVTNLLPALEEATGLFLKLSDAAGLTTFGADKALAEFTESLDTESLKDLTELLEMEKFGMENVADSLDKMLIASSAFVTKQDKMRESGKAYTVDLQSQAKILSDAGVTSLVELTSNIIKKTELQEQYKDRVIAIEDEIASRKIPIIDTKEIEETIVQLGTALASLGEIKFPELPDYKSTEQSLTGMMSIFNEHISQLEALRQAGVDTTSLLTEEWSTYADNVAQYYGEDSANYQAVLNMKKDADSEYLEWKMEKWEEEHEFEMGMMDIMAAGYDTMINSLTDTEMTGKERREAIWESMKDSVIGVLGDILKESIKNAIITAAISNAARAAEIAAAATTGAAVAAAWAPAAALSSLASFGANAIPAEAGMLSVAGTAQLIAAMGFQFGTSDEGYTVPSGYPNDSYLFAAKSGENVTVTPAGKPTGNSDGELIAAIGRLEIALASQPKYNIRSIDKIEISEMVEDGNFARSRI